MWCYSLWGVNTLRHEKNGCHTAGGIFKATFIFNSHFTDLMVNKSALVPKRRQAISRILCARMPHLTWIDVSNYFRNSVDLGLHMGLHKTSWRLNLRLTIFVPCTPLWKCNGRIFSTEVIYLLFFVVYSYFSFVTYVKWSIWIIFFIEFRSLVTTQWHFENGN